MFDSATAGLIRQAPNLTGVTADDLPQDLTRLYSELVAIRMRSSDILDDPEVAERLKKLKRVADVYEAYSDISDQSPARRAAAFVSATAYQLLGALLPEIYGPESRLLSVGWIHPSVASPLLFLISGQHADAREAARALRGAQGSDLLQTALIESVHDLAIENFDEILARGARLSRLQPGLDGDLSEIAAQTLYGLCWAGLVQLVAEVSGRNPPETSFAIGESARSTFDLVAELSGREMELSAIPSPEGLSSKFLLSAITGPRHIARLLRNISDNLQGAGIASLASPGGVDGEFWSRWLRHRALSRPILWENHRSALAQGMLEKGKSTVLVLPTGAGKTTLSELKVGAALARGENVIFLVPTLALVDQVKEELTECFPSTLKDVSVSGDGDLAGLMPSTELRDIEVMTPERCLALLNHAPEALEDTGLVVFDECHLLSPQGGGARSLDAMLCLLHLVVRAKNADFLFLSAMLTNPALFSSWIEDITKRPCAYFEDLWKPSRQARGLVVYSAGDFRINNDHYEVVPYGLFALHQNWAENKPTDLKLVKLLEKTVNLKRSDGGWPQPNANGVAGILSVATCQAGLKTILFVQQADHAPSVASRISKQLPSASDLTLAEQRLWEEAKIELGGEQFSLIEVGAGAIPHNGDMLPQERRLAESIFRRLDGAGVIVATPTLAQGMNLPAQVAIIAGTKRHDEGKRQPLEVHEVLNAAGRAGRAGHLANGVVLMIPEPVMKFYRKPTVAALKQLRMLQPSSDRCVEIIDPLTKILDRIHLGNIEDTEVQYLVGNLRSREGESIEGGVNLVKRSFAAFCARSNAAEQEFNQAVDALKSILEGGVADADVSRIAASSGIPSVVLSVVRDALEKTIGEWPGDLIAWSVWLVDFVGIDQQRIKDLFGRSADTITFVVRGKKTGGPLSAAELNRLKAGLAAWLSGKPLSEIELALGVPANKRKTCRRARDLILKLANRSLYIAVTAISEIAQVISKKHSAPADLGVLETLGYAVRKGFDSPGKVALAYLKPGLRSRVELHKEYSELPGKPNAVGGDFSAVLNDTAGRLALNAFSVEVEEP